MSELYITRGGSEKKPMIDFDAIRAVFYGSRVVGGFFFLFGNCCVINVILS